MKTTQVILGIILCAGLTTRNSYGDTQETALLEVNGYQVGNGYVISGTPQVEIARFLPKVTNFESLTGHLPSMQRVVWVPLTIQVNQIYGQKSPEIKSLSVYINNDYKQIFYFWKHQDGTKIAIEIPFYDRFQTLSIRCDTEIETYGEYDVILNVPGSDNEEALGVTVRLYPPWTGRATTLEPPTIIIQNEEGNRGGNHVQLAMTGGAPGAMYIWGQNLEYPKLSFPMQIGLAYYMHRETLREMGIYGEPFKISSFPWPELPEITGHQE
ncbi:hypothetical protein COB55_02335 [Candidatus Wolfebacteria bacterium]|nr:MAG: hypothetical protein COB55_02335 [Candidatus Wolfebacteria bacterium]